MIDQNLDATQDRPDDVADQNVGRLLSSAYHPEVPSPEFVRRTAQAMTVEAMAAQASRRAELSAPSSPPIVFRIARWTVAASLLIALGVLLSNLLTKTGRQTPGDERAVAQKERRNSEAAADSTYRLDRQVREWPVEDALTPRPRDTAPRAALLAVGDSLQTGPKQRRRVELPDGSNLYLNHDTAITLQAPRRVVLNRGEIFLEVAPRYDSPDGETKEGDRFVVLTPDRELIALGTKFNVRADGQKTSVAVVQGRVRVSGLTEPLIAGQEFAAAGSQPTETAVAPIEQTAHVIDWTRDLIVAAESPLVPASDYAGGALVAKRPDGQEASLSMRRYHIDVHIEDGFARTTIDQTYFNDKTWRMEGTFYFPLPPDASLSRLAMYVNGQLMEGGMAEREHARKTFETIVRRQKDPALLEWIDGSTFRMRVFPLEGRQEKRIVLSYTQRLPRSGDGVQYRFPGGHNMPIVDRWSCSVRVLGAAGRSWEADAYDFQAAKRGNDLLLQAKADGIKPARNLVIRLSDAPARERRQIAVPATGADAEFAQAQHEGHRYLAVRCPFRSTREPQPRRRDWVFLFEASADRDPILARVQLDVIKTLLENAERDDTFTILAASSRIRRLADQPLTATPANVKKATDFLEKTQLVGALDLEAALRAAAVDLKQAANPCLVHVGSAYPKLGETEHDALLRLLPQNTCYAGVGVGNRWNRALMKQAVGQTGGYCTQINPDEPVQWRTIELLSRLNAPRLVNAKVVDDRETLQFLTPMDVVCQGEDLFAVARMDGKSPLPEYVEVTGRMGDEPFVRRLKVSEVAPDAGYLPRTWAKLQIDRLVAEDALAHRDEIVGLSMAMYVMSPFTSLLVLENEQMYQEFNVDRGRKDHWALYPCPEKIDVVHEPLTGQVEPRKKPAADPEEQKPSVDTILRTILVRTPRLDQSGNRSVSVWQLMQPHHVWSQPGGDHNWHYTPAYWGRNAAGRINVNAWDGGQFHSGNNDLGWRSVDLSVPLLDRTPYVNRLFRNVGIGRETQSLMMMVTPRIIIQEEEELLLNPWDLDFETAGWNGLNFTAPRDVNGRAAGDPDINGLIELITGTVAPDAWNEAGGPGNIAFPANLSLVVNHTRDGLDFDRQLLTRVYFDDVGIPIYELAFSPDGRMLASHAGDSTVRIWNVDRGFSRERGSSLDRNANVFSQLMQDLLAMAPGMHTTSDDVCAVLDAESHSTDRVAIGKIDRRAAALIDRARTGGWNTVSIPQSPGAVMRFAFDGQGCCRIDAQTPLGLTEQILCDGESLWHQYPELGVGSKRQYSRFHRAAMARLIPWLVPPVEDLARNADVLAVDEHTVAVIPHASDKTQQDGSERERAELRLIFADDGRLSQRQVVLMPSTETILRETYSIDGTIRTLDENNRELATWRIPAESCAMPALEADDSLVILPMPWRTREHVVAARGLTDNGVFDDWSDEDALAVLTAETAMGNTSMRSTIGWCFLDEGDRRLGFYSLLLAAGVDWTVAEDGDAENTFDVRQLIDRIGEQSDEPLARYATAVQKLNKTDQSQNIGPLGDNGTGFLQQLATLHDLRRGWLQADSGEAGERQQAKIERQTVRYLRRCHGGPFASAALSLATRYGGEEAFVRVFEQTASAFHAKTAAAFAVRFQHVQAVAAAGDATRALTLLQSLVTEILDAGLTPMIDKEVKATFFTGDEGKVAWRATVGQLVDATLNRGAGLDALVVARRLHELGESEAADRVFASVNASRPQDLQVPDTLAAISYLWATEQQTRAAAMLEPLLKDDLLGAQPALWRLAAAMADKRALDGRAAEYLDRAVDLEYAQLEAEVDLKRIRTDYRHLLEQYRDAAEGLAGAGPQERRRLVSRIVRAADRWRAMDTQCEEVCRLAADTLAALGAVDLAWDYLTSPLASQAETTIPWYDRGREYHQQGKYGLAERAYAQAFRADPTNAEILWQQSQTLIESGHRDAAQPLLEQIAKQTWDSKYQQIRRQAQRILAQ